MFDDHERRGARRRRGSRADAPAPARPEPALSAAPSQSRSARPSWARRWTRRRRRREPSTCATPSTSRRCARPPPPPAPPPAPPPPTCSCAGPVAAAPTACQKIQNRKNITSYCKYLYRKSYAVIRRVVWVPRVPRLVGGAGAAILRRLASPRSPGSLVDT